MGINSVTKRSGRKNVNLTRLPDGVPFREQMDRYLLVGLRNYVKISPHRFLFPGQSALHRALSCVYSS